jgi:hypothetical protein
MTLERAIAEAKREAQADDGGLVIVVVNAPIENAEDEDGPYGYCPAEAVPYLFKHGTPVGEAICNGEYTPYPTN